MNMRCGQILVCEATAKQAFSWPCCRTPAIHVKCSTTHINPKYQRQIVDKSKPRTTSGLSMRRVAQAFDFGGITNRMGAPSFAFFTMGGTRNACAGGLIPSL